MHNFGQGPFASIEYDAVPDDFQPPLRTFGPWRFTVTMRTSGPTALGSVDVQRIESDDVYSASREAFGRPPREHQAAIREDIDAVEFDTTRADRADNLRARGIHRIRCGYNDKSLHYFWYRVRPAAAYPARLAARVPNHPLLAYGPSIENCPTTSTEAARMRRVR